MAVDLEKNVVYNKKKVNTVSYFPTYPMLGTKLIEIYENRTQYEILLSPIEKNLATSLASILRKVILQYTIGAAIIGVKINNIKSEFDNLPGLREDTVQLILNLKNLIFEIQPSYINIVHTLYINKSGPGKIYGYDITQSNEIKVINPELELGTISDQSNVSIELLITSGVGNNLSTSMLDTTRYIPITSSFSPILNVAYSINTYPHYEELAFHLSTNNSVEAKKAFFHAIDFLKIRFSQLLPC